MGTKKVNMVTMVLKEFLMKKGIKWKSPKELKISLWDMFIDWCDIG